MIGKKIALALGGGASLGFAHIGVIKAFEENGIYFDLITGTSMGAVVGGAYAYTLDIKLLEEKALRFSRSKITDFRPFPLSKNSLCVGKRADRYFKVVLGSKTPIEATKIPFGAVAVDVVSGEVEYMTTGKLWEAVRASMSIPAVFAPVEKGEKRLIDGGVKENVPVELAKKMGADIVIAVDVIDYNVIRANNDKMLGMLINSYHLAQIELSKYKSEKADIVIRPDLKGRNMLDFKKESTIKTIEAGYNKTIEMMPKIKKLLHIV